MSEYKPKSGMIDNRIVHDTHQRGIERVIQRKGDCYPEDYKGHNGKMGRGDKAHWDRRGRSQTPKSA